MAATVQSETTDMIVKRVSVPIGLEELMEGLAKEVLLKKPNDLYVFASEYFTKLLEMKQRGNYRSKPAKSVQSITRQSQKVSLENRKPPMRQLSRQLSIRGEPPPKKQVQPTKKEEKSPNRARRILETRRKTRQVSHVEQKENLNEKNKTSNKTAHSTPRDVPKLSKIEEKESPRDNKTSRERSKTRGARSENKSIQNTPRDNSRSSTRAVKSSSEAKMAKKVKESPRKSSTVQKDEKKRIAAGEIGKMIPAVGSLVKSGNGEQKQTDLETKQEESGQSVKEESETSKNKANEKPTKSDVNVADGSKLEIEEKTEINKLNDVDEVKSEHTTASDASDKVEKDQHENITDDKKEVTESFVQKMEETSSAKHTNKVEKYENEESKESEKEIAENAAQDIEETKYEKEVTAELSTERHDDNKNENCKNEELKIGAKEAAENVQNVEEIKSEKDVAAEQKDKKDELQHGDKEKVEKDELKKDEEGVAKNAIHIVEDTKPERQVTSEPANEKDADNKIENNYRIKDDKKEAAHNVTLDVEEIKSEKDVTSKPATENGADNKIEKAEMEQLKHDEKEVAANVLQDTEETKSEKYVKSEPATEKDADNIEQMEKGDIKDDKKEAADNATQDVEEIRSEKHVTSKPAAENGAENKIEKAEMEELKHDEKEVAANVLQDTELTKSEKDVKSDPATEKDADSIENMEKGEIKDDKKEAADNATQDVEEIKSEKHVTSKLATENGADNKIEEAEMKQLKHDEKEVAANVLQDTEETKSEKYVKSEPATEKDADNIEKNVKDEVKDDVKKEAAGNITQDVEETKSEKDVKLEPATEKYADNIEQMEKGDIKDDKKEAADNATQDVEEIKSEKQVTSKPATENGADNKIENTEMEELNHDKSKVAANVLQDTEETKSEKDVTSEPATEKDADNNIEKSDKDEIIDDKKEAADNATQDVEEIRSEKHVTSKPAAENGADNKIEKAEMEELKHDEKEVAANVLQDTEVRKSEKDVKSDPATEKDADNIEKNVKDEVKDDVKKEAAGNITQDVEETKSEKDVKLEPATEKYADNIEQMEKGDIKDDKKEAADNATQDVEEIKSEKQVTSKPATENGADNKIENTEMEELNHDKSKVAANVLQDTEETKSEKDVTSEPATEKDADNNIEKSDKDEIIDDKKEAVDNVRHDVEEIQSEKDVTSKSAAENHAGSKIEKAEMEELKHDEKEVAAHFLQDTKETNTEKDVISKSSIEKDADNIEKIVKDEIKYDDKKEAADYVTQDVEEIQSEKHVTSNPSAENGANNNIVKVEMDELKHNEKEVAANVLQDTEETKSEKNAKVEEDEKELNAGEKEVEENVIRKVHKKDEGTKKDIAKIEESVDQNKGERTSVKDVAPEHKSEKNIDPKIEDDLNTKKVEDLIAKNVEETNIKLNENDVKEITPVAAKDISKQYVIEELENKIIDKSATNVPEQSSQGDMEEDSKQSDEVKNDERNRNFSSINNDTAVENNLDKTKAKTEDKTATVEDEDRLKMVPFKKDVNVGVKNGQSGLTENEGEEKSINKSSISETKRYLNMDELDERKHDADEEFSKVDDDEKEESSQEVSGSTNEKVDEKKVTTDEESKTQETETPSDSKEQVKGLMDTPRSDKKIEETPGKQMEETNNASKENINGVNNKSTKMELEQPEEKMLKKEKGIAESNANKDISNLEEIDESKDADIDINVENKIYQKETRVASKGDTKDTKNIGLKQNEHKSSNKTENGKKSEENESEEPVISNNDNDNIVTSEQSARIAKIARDIDESLKDESLEKNNEVNDLEEIYTKHEEIVGPETTKNINLQNSHKQIIQEVLTPENLANEEKPKENGLAKEEHSNSLNEIVEEKGDDIGLRTNSVSTINNLEIDNKIKTQTEGDEDKREANIEENKQPTIVHQERMEVASSAMNIDETDQTIKRLETVEKSEDNNSKSVNLVENDTQSDQKTTLADNNIDGSKKDLDKGKENTENEKNETKDAKSKQEVQNDDDKPTQISKEPELIESDIEKDDIQDKSVVDSCKDGKDNMKDIGKFNKENDQMFIENANLSDKETGKQPEETMSDSKKNISSELVGNKKISDVAEDIEKKSGNGNRSLLGEPIDDDTLEEHTVSNIDNRVDKEKINEVKLEDNSENTQKIDETTSGLQKQTEETKNYIKEDTGKTKKKIDSINTETSEKLNHENNLLESPGKIGETESISHLEVQEDQNGEAIVKEALEISVTHIKNGSNETNGKIDGDKKADTLPIAKENKFDLKLSDGAKENVEKVTGSTNAAIQKLEETGQQKGEPAKAENSLDGAESNGKIDIKNSEDKHNEIINQRHDQIESGTGLKIKDDTTQQQNDLNNLAQNSILSVQEKHTQENGEELVKSHVEDVSLKYIKQSDAGQDLKQGTLMENIENPSQDSKSSLSKSEDEIVRDILLGAEKKHHQKNEEHKHSPQDEKLLKSSKEDGAKQVEIPEAASDSLPDQSSTKPVTGNDTQTNIDECSKNQLEEPQKSKIEENKGISKENTFVVEEGKSKLKEKIENDPKFDDNIVKNIVTSSMSVLNPGQVDPAIKTHLHHFLAQEQRNVFSVPTLNDKKELESLEKSKLTSEAADEFNKETSRNATDLIENKLQATNIQQTEEPQQIERVTSSGESNESLAGKSSKDDEDRKTEDSEDDKNEEQVALEETAVSKHIINDFLANEKRHVFKSESSKNEEKEAPEIYKEVVDGKISKDLQKLNHHKTRSMTHGNIFANMNAEKLKLREDKPLKRSNSVDVIKKEKQETKSRIPTAEKKRKQKTKSEPAVDKDVDIKHPEKNRAAPSKGSKLEKHKSDTNLQDLDKQKQSQARKKRSLTVDENLKNVAVSYLKSMPMSSDSSNDDISSKHLLKANFDQEIESAVGVFGQKSEDSSSAIDTSSNKDFEKIPSEEASLNLDSETNQEPKNLQKPTEAATKDQKSSQEEDNEKCETKNVTQENEAVINNSTIEIKRAEDNIRNDLQQEKSIEQHEEPEDKDDKDELDQNESKEKHNNAKSSELDSTETQENIGEDEKATKKNRDSRSPVKTKANGIIKDHLPQLQTGSSESEESKAFVNAVTTIQKIWRGFKIRKLITRGKLFGNTVEKEKHVNEKLKNAHDKSAVKIQSTWRGYQTRKRMGSTEYKKLNSIQEESTTEKFADPRQDVKSASSLRGKRSILKQHSMMVYSKENSPTESNEENQTKVLSEEDVAKALKKLEELVVPSEIPELPEKQSLYRGDSVEEPSVLKESVAPLDKTASSEENPEKDDNNNKQEDAGADAKNATEVTCKDCESKVTSLEKEVKDKVNEIMIKDQITEPSLVHKIKEEVTRIAENNNATSVDYEHQTKNHSTSEAPIEDRPQSIDSTDSAITVIYNPKDEDSEQNQAELEALNHSIKKHEELIEQVRNKLQEEKQILKDEKNAKHGSKIQKRETVKEDNVTNSIKEHVDLIDQAQNNLLDQISGHANSKFDVEKLRKEIEEAAIAYKSDNEDAKVENDEHDHLLEYLNDFEPEEEPDATKRDLPDIQEEEEEKKSEEGKDQDKIKKVGKVEEETGEKLFCGGCPVKDHFQNTIEGVPLEELVEKIEPHTSSKEEIEDPGERKKQLKNFHEDTADSSEEHKPKSDVTPVVSLNIKPKNEEHPEDKSPKTELVHTSSKRDTVVVPLNVVTASSSNSSSHEENAKVVVSISPRSSEESSPQKQGSVVVSLSPPRVSSPPKVAGGTSPQEETEERGAGGVESGNQTSIQLSESSPAGDATVTRRRGAPTAAGRGSQQAAPPAAAAEWAVEAEGHASRSTEEDTESGSRLAMERKQKKGGDAAAEKAATKIQAGFRGYQVRKQLKLKNGSSDITPRTPPSNKRPLRRKNSKENKTPENKNLEEESAVKIQAGIRGFLVRRRQKKQKTEA